ncbi:hypothetical protein AB0D04_36680, partial [Streptomyces sp. NPDC048483]|uniref:hypothetical protein n=1 Tax=Streptomyces sp. NPDC048483 TaxID=3154927 RepID=UPI00341EBC16
MADRCAWDVGFTVGCHLWDEGRKAEGLRLLVAAARQGHMYAAYWLTDELPAGHPLLRDPRVRAAVWELEARNKVTHARVLLWRRGIRVGPQPPQGWGDAVTGGVVALASAPLLGFLQQAGADGYKAARTRLARRGAHLSTGALTISGELSPQAVRALEGVDLDELTAPDAEGRPV